MIRFADFLCGVGGFHVGAVRAGLSCVWAVESDRRIAESYRRNFGMDVHGDFRDVGPATIPDHDVALVGLPCQPFSVAGRGEGTSRPDGRLLHCFAAAVAVKRPAVVVIENVGRFLTMDSGRIHRLIHDLFTNLGYWVQMRYLDCRDFGLPQRRKRAFVVAHIPPVFRWPTPCPRDWDLADFLEADADDCWRLPDDVREKYAKIHTPDERGPLIWHRDYSGQIRSHPFSPTLQAHPSRYYLTVDGTRRLTHRELFRLQGFPDDFAMPDTVRARVAASGNAVAVPVAAAIARSVRECLEHPDDRPMDDLVTQAFAHGTLGGGSKNGQ